MSPKMIPPLVGLAAAKLRGSRLTSTLAFVPGPAGLWICMPIGGLVRPLKPAAEPYPTAMCMTIVPASKVMPPEMVLPDPVLFVTTGTSLLGLKPTAWSVPEGERSKWTRAACDVRAAAERERRTLNEAFMRLLSLVGWLSTASYSLWWKLVPTTVQTVETRRW